MRTPTVNRRDGIDIGRLSVFLRKFGVIFRIDDFTVHLHFSALGKGCADKYAHACT